MNAKTLSAALILSLAALSNANAAEPVRVDHIVDLPTMTVRPDPVQVAHIVDLPAMTVRPDAALAAELATQPQVARIVDLPTVNVYPTVEQLTERAAIVAAEHAQVLTAQLAANLLAETLAVALP